MPLLPCRFQPSYFPPSLPFLTKVIYIMSKTPSSVKGSFWTVIINISILVIGCDAANDQNAKKRPTSNPNRHPFWLRRRRTGAVRTLPPQIQRSVFEFRAKPENR